MKKHLKKILGIVSALSLLLTFSVSATEDIRRDLEGLENTLSTIMLTVGGISVPGIPLTFKFTENLKQGSRSVAVKYLQMILNSDLQTQVATSGPGSSNNETEFFGPATTSAVARFQQKYAQVILHPAGLIQGTGFVGQSTRAKLNEMVGGTISPEDSLAKAIREIQEALKDILKRVEQLEGKDEVKSLRIITPKENEKWEVGEKYEIRWESEGIDNVDIYIAGTRVGFPMMICNFAPGTKCPPVHCLGRMVEGNINASLGRYEIIPEYEYDEGSYLAVRENPGSVFEECKTSSVKINISKKETEEDLIDLCKEEFETAKKEAYTGNIGCGEGAPMLNCRGVYQTWGVDTCITSYLKKLGWVVNSGLSCSESCLLELGYDFSVCKSFGVFPAGLEEKRYFDEKYIGIGETSDCLVSSIPHRVDGVIKNCYCSSSEIK